jgi:hydroxyacyl-ACP dehydratase HTD2-like protein with hotdog domain
MFRCRSVSFRIVARGMPGRPDAVAGVGWLSRIRSVIPCQRRYSTNGRGVGSKVELYYDSSRTITDLLTPGRSELLRLTIAPYLPTTKTDKEPLSVLPPGYHFGFFPTSASELDTLEDGYEKYFAPTRAFKRRLWTRGQLEFKEPGLVLGISAECKESLYKIVESENATDVWIDRRIYNTSTGNPEDWSVRELRCLRYIHDLPPSQVTQTSANSESSGLKPFDPSVLLRHTFTPSRILLTRFAFLTYNFHRIHIDPEYARTIEQYPDVLMHGSLSILVILSALTQFYEVNPLSITRAKYVMHRPLYVNNLVTLTHASRKDGRRRTTLHDNHGNKAVELISSGFP